MVFKEGSGRDKKGILERRVQGNCSSVGDSIIEVMKLRARIEDERELKSV